MIIPVETFLDKLAYQFSRYFTAKVLFPPPRPNLIEAGSQKGRNWGLLYGGGATTAFLLDVELRSLTKGKVSLDDWMKYLCDEFGRSKRLTAPDLISALEEVSGHDFESFFSKYVSGSQFLPILQACERAGL